MDIDFSFLDLFGYWEVLKEYINPLSTLCWAIMGGVIGFVIFLVVEILYRKKILVRRRNWGLKVFSYLYLLFFPLYAGFCFTQWFAYHNVEKQLVANVPTYLDGAYRLCDDHLKEVITSTIDARYLESTTNELIDEGSDYLVTAIAAAIATKDLEEKEVGKLSKLKYRFTSYLYVKYMKKELMDKFTSYVDKHIMLQKGVTEELLNVRIQDIIDIGLIEVVVQKHISSFFGKLKMQAILLLLIGIAIPAVEITIANYLERQSLKD